MPKVIFFSLGIAFDALASGVYIRAAFGPSALTGVSGWPQLFYAGHNTGMAQVRPRQLIMLVIPAAVQKRNDQLQDEGHLNFTSS